MEEHNRKKEEKEANQKKREIAELKAARENAERKLAALTDKQEKTQDELSKIGLGRFFLEQRVLESVIVGHEMELANLKQKDLVEALNQELDDITRMVGDNFLITGVLVKKTVKSRADLSAGFGVVPPALITLEPCDYWRLGD